MNERSYHRATSHSKIDGARHMVNDSPDSEKGNLVPPVVRYLSPLTNYLSDTNLGLESKQGQGQTHDLERKWSKTKMEMLHLNFFSILSSMCN